ncbi:MAG: hypothetical protein ACYST3_05640 [Planctomycetota bacterium]|jgi:hypothetical protein
MPVAGKADVVIDKTTLGTTGFVTITAGDATHTSVGLQDLYDAVREWEDDLENLDVEALFDGSGKEGIGGGDRKPPTVTARAHVQCNATAGAGPTVRIFTFSGGTLLSDEEAADAADPRSPLKPEAFVEYDRTKGQEGALLNEADLALLRKAHTNRQELVNVGTEAVPDWRWRTWDDDDSTLLTDLDHYVQDADGNQIVILDGAVVRRSKGGLILP